VFVPIGFTVLLLRKLPLHPDPVDGSPPDPHHNTDHREPRRVGEAVLPDGYRDHREVECGDKDGEPEF